MHRRTGAVLPVVGRLPFFLCRCLQLPADLPAALEGPGVSGDVFQLRFVWVLRVQDVGAIVPQRDARGVAKFCLEGGHGSGRVGRRVVREGEGHE